MIYYFIDYYEGKIFNDYLCWESFFLGEFHCLALIKTSVKLSGCRGKFTGVTGDYILWTSETNNIKIE